MDGGGEGVLGLRCGDELTTGSDGGRWGQIANSITVVVFSFVGGYQSVYGHHLCCSRGSRHWCGSPLRLVQGGKELWGFISLAC